MDQIIPFFKTPTLTFIFLVWVFLLLTLKLVERALYFIQSVRDKDQWRKHSSLCTAIMLLANFGAMMGAIVFITGILYMLYRK